MDDLSKLLIVDSEYYNPNCKYTNFFERYNINTIDQILDNSFTDISKNCYIKTKNQLYGLISMLRYKYLNEPLYCEYLLDKEIDFKEIDHSLYLGLNIPLKENLSFFPLKYLSCTEVVRDEIIKDLLNNYKYLKENPKLINYLKLLLNMESEMYKQIYPFINTYICVYEKNLHK